MKSNDDTPNSPKKSILHNGIVIKGDLRGEGHLTIAGCVEGGVELKRGELVVSQTGYVQGNIDATQAHIDGEVRGSIRAKRKVSMGSSAKVLGDVTSNTLNITEGAKCNGCLAIGALRVKKTVPLPKK